MHIYHAPTATTHHAYTARAAYGMFAAIVTKRTGGTATLTSRVIYPSRFLARKAAKQVCKTLATIHAAQSNH